MIVDFDEFFINYENSNKEYTRFRDLIFEIKNILNVYKLNCELSIKNEQFEHYFIGYKAHHIDKKLDFIDVYFKYDKNINYLTINLTVGHYFNYSFLESSTYAVIKNLIEDLNVNYKFKYDSILIKKRLLRFSAIGGIAVGGAFKCSSVPIWSGQPHQ